MTSALNNSIKIDGLWIQTNEQSNNQPTNQKVTDSMYGFAVYFAITNNMIYIWGD